jgi:hypothetical protein
LFASSTSSFNFQGTVKKLFATINTFIMSNSTDTSPPELQVRFNSIDAQFQSMAEQLHFIGQQFLSVVDRIDAMEKSLITHIDSINDRVSSYDGRIGNLESAMFRAQNSIEQRACLCPENGPRTLPVCK